MPARARSLTPVELARENRKLRRTIRHLTGSVLMFLELIDVEMQKPHSNERGKRIALLANALELATDAARYGALGVDFQKDGAVRKLKEAHRRRP